MEPGPDRPDGGLAALLDFGFTKFITLGVVKIIYLLGIGLIGLGFLAALISSFTMGVFAILGVMIVGPIIALLYLMFFRIWLELVVVIFRIAENTTKMVELQGGTSRPPSVSSSGGPPIQAPIQ